MRKRNYKFNIIALRIHDTRNDHMGPRDHLPKGKPIQLISRLHTLKLHRLTTIYSNRFSENKIRWEMVMACQDCKQTESSTIGAGQINRLKRNKHSKLEDLLTGSKTG